ncbi:T9SS type A sorting domain-containing protein [Flavobacterium zepuense]|uniref:T9SS type A sorting domain-containing protein n=1 Tax=Flavobacterium zepuense TaxID=2593302 RepID=A0A552V318_9FLAO|nr:T9SS type A sorting domain-containing protein [Flavobacterium zepuense]TRW24848.1 T9SS type A sorting domain-containing protein [Flavobacterium zepuense]
MKKTLLTGAFLLALSFGANAQQTVIISQDFEDLQELADQEWGGIDLDGDEVTFSPIQTQTVLTQLGFSGNVMGSMNFILDDENNPVPVEGSDNILITPILELPVDEPVSLSLRLSGIGTTQTAVSHYAIYVVLVDDFENSGDDIESFTAFINEQTPVAEDGTNGLSEVFTYDISEYAGEEVTVLIRHFESEESTYLFIDDLEVKSGTLGVKEVTASAFKVYPNPATSVINLEGANGSQFNNAVITDVNGRTVKTLALNGVTNAVVNVEDLASGTYILSVTTDKGVVTKKIVKN